MSTLSGDARPHTGRKEALNQAVHSISGMFPCYNDEATIAAMVGRLREALVGCGVPFEIIVVDDGSTDGSGEVLRRLGSTVPELRVIRHPVNRGYGAALQSGFRAARLEWVFYTDGDGQYDAGEMVDLVGLAAADVDWVQGWKIVRHDDWWRRALGRAYHHFVRLLFLVKVRDTDCDFRLIRRDLLDRMNLSSTSGAICAEMVYKCRRAGARVVETPVHHYSRPVGTSQFFRAPHIARMVSEVLLLWLRLVVLRRPHA